MKGSQKKAHGPAFPISLSKPQLAYHLGSMPTSTTLSIAVPLTRLDLGLSSYYAYF